MKTSTLQTTVSTLAEMIAERGRLIPDKIAFHFEGDQYSFGHVFQEASRFGAQLIKRGVGRGDRVVLLIPNGAEFFYTFYGVLLAGAVAVPLFPGTAPDRNFRIARFCNASCLVLPANTPPAEFQAFIAEGEAGNIPVLTYDPTANHPPLEPARVTPDDLAFLQFTSGSTGDPKGVMLTHGALMTNVSQMIDGMEITDRDIFVSWLPVYHDMGLILMTIAPFYLGAKLVLLPTSLSNVRVWLKAIHEHRGTFTAAPDFAWRLCLRYIRNPDEFDLTSLRVALDAAEPVRAKTISDFQSTFHLGHVVAAGYGLAEATVGVSMSRPHVPAKVDARGLVSVGPPFRDVAVKIVGENGETLPPGTIGDIYVKSASNSNGYFNNPEATAQLFKENGFFDTGDMGYLDGEGHLFIAGRKKNIIITAGRTLANQEIEETVDRHPKVRFCAAVGVDKGHVEGEQVFIFAEVRGGSSLSSDALNDIAVEIVDNVHNKLGFRPGRVYLVRSRTIPQTYNGKIQHARLKKQYLSGRLREKDRILYPDY